MAAAIVVAALAAYAIANRVLLWRVRGRRAGLETFRPGTPGVLYFTSPGCLPCQTVQRPALMSLKERLGDRLQIVEVDVADRPDLADYWGVLSVPTTFVIDRRGEPRCINHGVTAREKILQQLIDVSGEWLSLAEMKSAGVTPRPSHRPRSESWP